MSYKPSSRTIFVAEEMMKGKKNRNEGTPKVPGSSWLSDGHDLFGGDFFLPRSLDAEAHLMHISR